MIGRATLGRPTLGAVRRSDVAPRATVRVLGGGSALGAVAPPAPSPEEQARAYARAIRWRLRIPGEHYSGLSNQAMLDVRAREGRDFAADTPLLRANANRALYAEARAWARWSEVRAARVWSDVVFDQILARLENGDIVSERCPVARVFEGASRRSAHFRRKVLAQESYAHLFGAIIRSMLL